MSVKSWIARAYELAGLMALAAVFGYLLGYVVMAVPFCNVAIAMIMAAATVMVATWVIEEEVCE